MSGTRGQLQNIGLNSENCIVIGSGILSALGIRESNDIDIVVREAKYDEFRTSGSYTKGEFHGREILTDDVFDIGTSWGVLGKNQTFDDLVAQSVVIDEVRYISIELLLQVKESWVREDEVIRPKDVNDIKLIKEYLGAQHV